LTTTAAINQATYFTVPNLPYFVKSPAVAAMNKALDKYAPGVRKHPTYGELPMEARIAGKMFQAAALAGHVGANGKAPPSAAIVKGLDSLNGATLGGFAPPLTFTAGKPHPVDCWYWAVLKAGKYSTPFGLKPSCQSAS
jgi:branched-chain amino acid transport system substrate-binding protein